MTTTPSAKQAAFANPRLLADIGGTYARFTLETAAGLFEHSQSLLCADYPDFHAAIKHYLKGLKVERIKNAALAIANPVSGDQVRMTNYHWQFSIEEMRARLQFDNLVVVNDFTALAMSLPKLLPNQRRQIGGGHFVADSVIGLIGAGSGLGVSGLIPAGAGWVALGSEGGHASFSPRNPREIAILEFAWKQLEHVSFERLLSGPGIELIYQALSARAKNKKTENLAAPEITSRALNGSDAVCVETLETFCEMLGTAAANLAVTQGALGGIYIGGGIVPRLGEYFDRSQFRKRFEDKGRFSDYLKGIPTYVITESNATFMGASVILAAQLDGLEASEDSSILNQIRRVRDGLSPAEQRVADLVIAQPRTALNEPIAKLARAANVSQPTVIRFCRSLGCDGLSNFKLRLASGLTGTMPITHIQVTDSDSMLELGDKVLSNTASAILQVRNHLNPKTIDQVVRLISDAKRVEFYAVGHFGSVAEDAQFKFLRMGVSAMSYTAPRLQLLAANVLDPSVVVVVISGSGQIQELLEVVDKAKERGATVVAITASQSALARKADIALILDNIEDSASQVPMISRILHLLMIDILVVGITMQRGIMVPALEKEASHALDEERPQHHPSTDGKQPGPGLHLSGELAHLTANSAGAKHN
jgi:glucokinase